LARPDDALGAWAAVDADAATVLATASRRIARARGLSQDCVGRFADPLRDRDVAELPPISDPLDLGRLHEARMGDPSGRKAAGAFYTPAPLAAELTRATILPALARARRPGELRIADPSCGAGSFLIHALRAIRTADPSLGAASLARCMHGADLDPLAVALCVDALWLELGDRDLDPGTLEPQIHCGDALVDTTLPDSPPDWRPLHWDALAPHGVDVLLGNPPWDRDEPDSRAFFGEYDPAHRTRVGAAAAQSRADILARHPEAAARWNRTLRFLAARQRFLRTRFPDSAAAAKTNAYQRFLALALGLLRPGGRIGFLVPAGFYADHGSAGLRRRVFDEHHVEALIGFDNRSQLFPGVDRRFKFAAVIAEKRPPGGETRLGFLRSSPDSLLTATPLDTRRVRALSPSSGALVEVETMRDLDLLARLTSQARLGGNDWQVRYRRELDLTLDRGRFVAQREPDDLPVWEGRMIDAFSANAKHWVSGHGRRARWEPPSDPNSLPRAQFHVRAGDLAQIDPEHDTPKVGFMAIGSATNARTMVATVLWRAPCGNSVPTLRCRPTGDGGPGEFALCAVLNSTVFDWALRLRMAGNNLNRFVLDDVAVPKPGEVFGIDGLDDAVRSLAFASSWFDPLRAAASRRGSQAVPMTDEGPRRHLRAVLDALVARAYGLSETDYAHVLTGTDLPCERLTPTAISRAPLPAKGLWRIDRELPPSERLPALALAAFRRLEAGAPTRQLLRAASRGPSHGR